MNIGNIEMMDCAIMVGNQYILTSSNTGEQATVKCTVFQVIQGTLPLAGTFIMSFDTRTTSTVLVQGVYNTSAIAHDAVATRTESGGDGTSMEEILEALPNIGDVAVTRGAVTNTTGGYTWTVTFLRDTYSNLTCSNNGVADAVGCQTTGDVLNLNANFVPENLNTLLGDGTSVTHVETQKGKVLRGDFTLTHGSAYGLMAWNIPAADMDAKLEALSSDNVITNVDVTRERYDKFGSHIWTITYTKNQNHWPPGSGDIPELTQ